MIRGSDMLPILIFGVILWIGNKIYNYGYNKGVEDERNNKSRP